MTRIRQSAAGYLIAERNGDLYLDGSEDVTEARKECQKERATRVYNDGDMVRVEIGNEGIYEGGFGDEWGTGPDRETAWRFALGAYYGSFNDPIVMEIPEE